MIKLLSFADVITITNAMLGFLALLFILSNQFQIAAAFILIGLLADGLDGIVARRVGNGQMGEFLETIADSTSLSIAPLFLLYKINYDVVISQLSLHLLLGIVIVFSFVCSMLRLSSFSALKEKRFFVGLPTSANAIFLVMSSFLKVDVWYIIPFIVLFAWLMISPIHFPKHGVKSDIVAAAFIIGTILLNFLYNDIAPILLLVGLMLYMIAGPLYLFMGKKNIQLKGT
jgi:CDP-diacylglycerol---serine O-phosphatidyltransferase